MIEWYPREREVDRSKGGRRHQRIAARGLWRRKAHDRELWKRLGEAYAEKQNNLITDV